MVFIWMDETGRKNAEWVKIRVPGEMEEVNFRGSLFLE
jgi:hypothetical protein